MVMAARVITPLFGERGWCLGLRLWAGRPSPPPPPLLKGGGKAKGEGAELISSGAAALHLDFFFSCAVGFGARALHDQGAGL